jgi:23S rRNA (guanosine2251-2'-O)-methyltransferase
MILLKVHLLTSHLLEGSAIEESTLPAKRMKSEKNSMKFDPHKKRRLSEKKKLVESANNRERHLRPSTSSKLPSVDEYKKHGLRLVIGKRAVAEVLLGASKKSSVGASVPCEILVTHEQRKWLSGCTIPPQIDIREVSSEALSACAYSSSHQGVAVVVKPAPPLKLKDFYSDWREAERVVLLAIDGVKDPGNFGALLRAAECFGASGAIYSRNRCPSITPSVTKSSAGASECLSLFEVSNTSQALLDLSAEGFMVISAACSATARCLDTFVFPSHVVLVVGTEGEGIQDLILRRSDVLLTIPMRGSLQSLNVSQATAVLLSSFWCSFKNLRP